MAEKTSYGQKNALTAGDNTNKENLVNEYIQKAESEETAKVISGTSQALSAIRTTGSEIISERSTLKTNLENIYKKRNQLYENILTGYNGNIFTHKIGRYLSEYKKGIKLNSVLNIDKTNSELFNAIEELQTSLYLLEMTKKIAKNKNNSSQPDSTENEGGSDTTQTGSTGNESSSGTTEGSTTETDTTQNKNTNISDSVANTFLDSFRKQGNILYQQALKIRADLGYSDINIEKGNDNNLKVSGLDRSSILNFGNETTNISGTIKDIQKNNTGTVSLTINKLDNNINGVLEDGTAEYPYNINNVAEYIKNIMKNYDPEKGTVYYNLPGNVVLNFSEDKISEITDINLFGTVNSGGSNIKIILNSNQTLTFSISFKPKDDTNIFIEKNGIVYDYSNILFERNDIDIIISSNQNYHLINTSKYSNNDSNNDSNPVSLNLITFGSLSKIKLYGKFALKEAKPFSESYPEDILKNLDKIKGEGTKELPKEPYDKISSKELLVPKSITILDEPIIERENGHFINISDYLYDDKFAIFSKLAEIKCSEITDEKLLNSTSLSEDLALLILLLKTSAIRYETDLNSVDIVAKYRSNLTELKKLCKNFSENLKTQNSNYLEKINNAISAFDNIESVRQANDSNYNSDYTIEIVSGFETISGLIETILIEDENLDVDNVFENIETNLNTLNDNIMSIIVDSSASIIKLNKYIDNYSVFFEPEDNYGKIFSEMLITASTEMKKHFGIRDFSSWKYQFSRFSADGIFGTGQLYIAQEVGLNSIGYAITNNDKISMASKDLVNDSIRRAYKKNLFAAQENIENILTLEEALADEYNLEISNKPQNEFLPAALTTEIPELSILNKYNISDILLLEAFDENNTKVKKIDALTELVFLKYIFNGRTNDSDIENKIRKLSEIFTKCLKNFKTVYSEWQFKKVVEAINRKINKETSTLNLNEYFNNIKIIKKEVDNYRMLWNLTYATQYSNLNSLVGLLGDTELINFLYKSNIAEDDFILSFPLTEATVTNALTALKNASNKIANAKI